jgi:lipid-A-disaccharide synthase
MARWYDHLMALLPFEPPYFQAVGLACTYVGHPVVESGADRGDGPAFRRRYGIDPDATLITVLPGSRRGEVHRLLPVFRAAIERLRQRYPALHVVIPTVSTVHEEVAAAAKDWGVRAVAVRGGEQKYDAFAASNAALAASGTVTLEVALANVPMVVAYRVNPLTHAIVRRLVKVRFANLLNIVLDRPAIPELLQHDCTPERLARELTQLLDDRLARDREIEAYDEGLKRLGRGDVSPGLRAADCVLSLIAERRP